MIQQQGRTGRRPGNPDTREEILAAARELFARRGFRGASVRAIAGEAGVDAALISHYFGGKDGLFRAALELPEEPVQILSRVVAGSTAEELPGRLAHAFVTIWEDPTVQPQLVVLLRRGLEHPDQVRSVPDWMRAQVLPPDVARHLSARHLSARADLPAASEAEVRLRFSLVQSFLLGVAALRHVLRLQPWADLAPGQLEALLVPTITHYLRDDLPLGPDDGSNP